MRFLLVVFALWLVAAVVFADGVCKTCSADKAAWKKQIQPHCSAKRSIIPDVEDEYPELVARGQPTKATKPTHITPRPKPTHPPKPSGMTAQECEAKFCKWLKSCPKNSCSAAYVVCTAACYET
ncbi:hypothetical protein DFQ30_000260, partial [Apophysomyces sp. BC1015]